MKEFFGETGSGDNAGVWPATPVQRPEFRDSWRRKLDKQAKARKAEEML
jgi:chlorophyllide a reductase subunit Y